MENHWRDWVDHRTEPGGRPRERKERTHICFYVAADKVSKSLQELCENKSVQEFMTRGGCIMQSTRLTESLSKSVGRALHKELEGT